MEVFRANDFRSVKMAIKSRSNIESSFNQVLYLIVLLTDFIDNIANWKFDFIDIADWKFDFIDNIANWVCFEEMCKLKIWLVFSWTCLTHLIPLAFYLIEKSLYSYSIPIVLRIGNLLLDWWTDQSVDVWNVDDDENNTTVSMFFIIQIFCTFPFLYHMFDSSYVRLIICSTNHMFDKSYVWLIISSTYHIWYWRSTY